MNTSMKTMRRGEIRRHWNTLRIIVFSEEDAYEEENQVELDHAEEEEKEEEERGNYDEIE